MEKMKISKELVIKGFDNVREKGSLQVAEKFLATMSRAKKEYPNLKYVATYLAKAQNLVDTFREEMDDIEPVTEQMDLLDSRKASNSKVPLTKLKTGKKDEPKEEKKETKKEEKKEEKTKKPSLKESLRKTGTQIHIKPMGHDSDEEDCIVNLYIKDYNNEPNNEAIILFSTTMNTCDLIYIKDIKGDIWNSDMGRYKLIIK